MKYYTLTNVLKKGNDCRYFCLFGERSSGKTYQCLLRGVERYFKYGEEMALIRRWREDFKGKRGASMFKNLECNEKGENIIKKLSKGQYDRVIYYASAWYMAYFDKETQKNVLAENPFCYAFALTEVEHDKSSSFGKVCTIVFDEFIPRHSGGYLPEEFTAFMNTISTIIRGRATCPNGEPIRIFMCANTNTAGRYCPYFREMGLNHISQMEKGDIDIYKFGESGLKVAVEYTDSPNKKGKPSDIYFAFDNPKLSMITGGDWEIDIYPHLTKDIDRKDIVFSYFITYEEKILQADIVINDNDQFTFIHEKTTPIRNEDTDIIFSLTPTEQHNHFVDMTKPVNNLTKKIAYFYKANKIFYQSNEVGELVTHYLTQCQKRYTMK